MRLWNGSTTLYWCLDPASLKQALMIPVHRGPMLNDILSKLNNVQYLSVIDESSGYHNLKLDERSSYLTHSHGSLADKIQEIAIWTSPYKRYIPKKNSQNI